MTKTAKERIEEEIKDVNRSLVYSLNKNGRAFDSGKRQGLMIALVHVENVKDYKCKFEKKLATAVEALEQSRERLGDFQEPWNDREKEVDLILSEALVEIGGEDE